MYLLFHSNITQIENIFIGVIKSIKITYLFKIISLTQLSKIWASIQTRYNVDLRFNIG